MHLNQRTTSGLQIFGKRDEITLLMPRILQRPNDISSQKYDFKKLLMSYD